MTGIAPEANCSSNSGGALGVQWLLNAPGNPSSAALSRRHAVKARCLNPVALGSTMTHHGVVSQSCDGA